MERCIGGYDFEKTSTSGMTDRLLKPRDMAPSLEEADAAALLNVSPKCPKKRRLNGSGPDCVRYSQRLIRYARLAFFSMQPRMN